MDPAPTVADGLVRDALGISPGVRLRAPAPGPGPLSDSQADARAAIPRNAIAVLRPLPRKIARRRLFPRVCLFPTAVRQAPRGERERSGRATDAWVRD